MQIIDPQATLWQQTDPIAHIARCARVCYGNAVSKGEEADKRLYESLKKSGHLSMFRHESVYAIIPNTSNIYIERICDTCNSPYINYIVAPDKIYVATNMNFIIDHDRTSSLFADAVELILKHRVSAEEFTNDKIGHKLMRYTFHITTQISTSRELNRVSPNNIAEKSSRYCLEDGVICRPHWLEGYNVLNYLSERVGCDTFHVLKAHSNEEDVAKSYMIQSYNGAFIRYKKLLDMGFKREDARGVLPLDTATEVVYTYSALEWKHIVELRTAPNAHPNARIIANMIKEQLEQLGYNF